LRSGGAAKGRQGGKDRRRARFAGPVLIALLSFWFPAAAFGDAAPKVGILSYSGGSTTVTLSAKINPEGLMTRYEFLLAAEGGPEEIGHGSIAAGAIEPKVSATAMSLKPDNHYAFLVVAVNSDGEDAREGEFTTEEEAVVPPGCPQGCGPQVPYELEVNPRGVEGALRSGEELARREAERQAQLKQEEALAASEREKREAGEGAAREAAERAAAQCVVPSLRGDSLGRARRTLSRAHCTLGKVKRGRLGAQRTVVLAQTVPAGHRLTAGAAVGVRLGRLAKR